MSYIDSHAHIFYDGKEDGYAIVDRIIEKGLKKVLIVCCTLQEANYAIELANKDNRFDVAFGIHPSDCKDYSLSYLDKVLEICSNPKVVAVGEIGLDYYWQKDNKEYQKEFFVKQIEIANKLNKPIIVHSRDAINDTYELLKKHLVNKKGIIHCFSSSVEMANEFIKLGYYISLGGPITFKNAIEPKNVAKHVPLDRLLLETDSPFLAPMPYRGKKNEPNYVEYVYKQVAELKEILLDEVINSVNSNYERLFYEKD